MSKIPLDLEKLGDTLNALETYQKRTFMVFDRIKAEEVKRMNMLGGFMPFVVPHVAEDINESNQKISDEIGFMADSLNLLIQILGEISVFVSKEENFFIGLVEEIYNQLGTEKADKIMDDANARFVSANVE